MTKLGIYICSFKWAPVPFGIEKKMNSGDISHVIITDFFSFRYPMEPEDDFGPDVLREFVDEFKSGRFSSKIC